MLAIQLCPNRQHLIWTVPFNTIAIPAMLQPDFHVQNVWLSMARPVGTVQTFNVNVRTLSKFATIYSKFLCILTYTNAARSCGQPPDSAHGWHAGECYTFGCRVTYHCSDGYELVGKTERFCQADGSWTPKELPTCVCE